MSSSNPKLVAIENGVDLLLKRINSLTALINDQGDRIDLLTNELSDTSDQRASLESENVALMAKIQGQLNQSSPAPIVDQEAYNQKINELVKEINSCISLLNK
jgi:chromosome condensin MukBEF ATPase and DNA-binding subunit MukB